MRQLRLSRWEKSYPICRSPRRERFLSWKFDDGFEVTITDGAILVKFYVGLMADGVALITHDHHMHALKFRGPDGKF